MGKVQDKVDDPEPPSMVLADSEQATLSTDRATSPTNPFNGETPIPTVEGVFTAIVTEVGLAEIGRASGREKATVTVGESAPDETVTVQIKLLILGKVQDKVNDP